jgi:hypothetical protein
MSMNGEKIGLILQAINFVRENESRLKRAKILYFYSDVFLQI